MSERESIILDRMKRSVDLETPYKVLEELDRLRASNAELLAAAERSLQYLIVANMSASTAQKKIIERDFAMISAATTKARRVE